jgi:sarcosine oxidase
VIVVVGAGVVGLAAASACARRGHPTLVLDRFEAGHTRGSSHGSERILRFAYTDPLYVELTKRSVPAWADLAEMADVALFDQVGCLDVGDPEELDALRVALEGGGIPHETVHGPEAARRWPGVASDGDTLHQWTAGVLQADAALVALEHSVEVAGGSIRRPARVRAIGVEADHAVVVLDDGETIEAEVVVVAGGPWARGLVPEAIALPPITVTEELVGFFEPRPGSPPLPCFVARRAPFLYGLPTPDGRYKLGEHGTGSVIDPDRRPDVPADLDERLAQLRSHAAHWLPGLDPDPIAWVTCLYASTPTEDPVLERHGPVVVAAGFGGHGFKFAPAAGEIVADLVEGRDGPAQLTVAGVHTALPRASGHR